MQITINDCNDIAGNSNNNNNDDGIKKIRVEIAKIGRGVDVLDVPAGTTMGKAISFSNYSYDDGSRLKLNRVPGATLETELQNGDRVYIVDNLEGGC